MALAGGALPWTVCSHLGGAGGGAHQLLSFLDYVDACRLREAGRELQGMVRDCRAWHRQCRQQWPAPAVAGLRMEGSLASWRSANSQALRANVTGRSDLLDADFVHLSIKVLDMNSCRQTSRASLH
jgi:hypothetical protein